jgi:hypothetical protein
VNQISIKISVCIPAYNRSAVLPAHALQNDPRPTWMIEVSTTEHQPVGTSINPNFQNTIELFFNHDYLAFTADVDANELGKADVSDFVANLKQLSTHNFLFR